ncbi:MAG: glycosyltransferase [Candidatus Altiarchaeota archaeon]|nr:glycosyltransferase [Candidatus Altiarchaeota archaeon]
MNVSIIIPCSAEHAKYLDDLFNALSKQKFKDEFEVILVLEDGNWGMDDKISNYPLNVKLCSSQLRNPGANRNIAIKEANGNVIAFIDSDCVPTENWLENLIKPLGEYDGSQGIDYSYDDSYLGKFMEKQQLNFLYSSVVDGRCKFIDTRNCAIRLDVLNKVGGFDERLETSEDKDLGYRLYKSGFNVVLNKEAIVYHRWRKGSLLGFFKWGMWYGKGDYVFRQKWDKMSFHSGFRSALNDLKSSLFYLIKSLCSSGDEREVNLLFSFRQFGVAFGKLKAMLFKT